MSAEHAEARRLARGPLRVAEPDGPTSEQWEAVDRIREDHAHVHVADWFPITGALYVRAGESGRLEVLYRVDEDGRAVPERIWS
jgi:hypothetical protein